MIKSTKQIILSQQIKINTYRSSHENNSKSITHILEAKLVEFGIDRAKYHGSDLEETSVIRLFQNSEKFFKQFSIEINKIITNETKKRSSCLYREIDRNIHALRLIVVIRNCNRKDIIMLETFTVINGNG